MGKIKKCKLSWRPSGPDPDVNYKLYWSNLSPIGYNSKFIELGNITEVDLPDILEGYEISEDSIYLGISAVDKWGNESDIITLSEPYKRSAPASPVDLTLNQMNYFKITTPKKKTETQDADLQKQATDNTDQEFQYNYRGPSSKVITAQGRIVDVIEAILPENG